MVHPTRLDYCQYLLSSPINYTLTHFADHSEDFSHDMINRYLAGERISPRLVWENVQPHLVQTEQGYVIFDDTVLDKRHARNIALVRRQYSGNAKGVINGIGVVTCVYVNPTLDRFWVIDYRIYDPETDGNTISLRCQCINSVNQVRVSGNACDFRSGKFLEDIRHIVLERRKRLVKLKGNRHYNDLIMSYCWSMVDC